MTTPSLQHPRARRLLPVLQQAEASEQQALHAWGQLQRQQQEAEAQRQQLLEYADDYRRKVALPSTVSLTSADMHNTLGFLTQVEQAIRAQQQQLQQLQARIDRAHQRYLDCHSKCRSLQGLIDRFEQEQQAARVRAEQKEADEWASRAAFRATQR